MASLRDLRSKIKSVKSTQQITKAMKMVSAARMRRAQQLILAGRPFAARMEDLVKELSTNEVKAAHAEGHEANLHPFFKSPKVEAEALILVTADKGLCGAFNANLLRSAVQFLREKQGKPVKVAVVGRKGRDFLRRVKSADVEIVHELAGIFPKVGFHHAEVLGDAMMAAFEGGKVSKITLIYNEFKSVAVQRIVRKTLLPLEAPVDDNKPEQRGAGEYLFEPGRPQLLSVLLPRYVKAQLYRVLLESQAAELAARMNAMDAATKNAGELMDSLTLHLNRTRQALITREIAELVGGAEALAQ